MRVFKWNKRSNMANDSRPDLTSWHLLQTGELAESTADEAQGWQGLACILPGRTPEPRPWVPKPGAGSPPPPGKPVPGTRLVPHADWDTRSHFCKERKGINLHTSPRWPGTLGVCGETQAGGAGGSLPSPLPPTAPRTAQGASADAVTAQGGEEPGRSLKTPQAKSRPRRHQPLVCSESASTPG